MDITGGISRFAGFLTTDIWRVRMENLHGAKKHLVRSLRIVLIAAEKFFEDRCTLRASSLTFFSLLSVVPVLAMAFAIATGFGLQNRLEQLIFEQFAGQEQVISRLVDFSRNLLQKTSGGYIAGVGAAFLFWAVISIIGSAEESFNHIWEIRKPRTIGRKLTDYLAVMLISPLLFVVSSSATVLIITQINRLLET
ncbi:MAG TPA: YihY/virulence factor BrkB family protein, partial [Deltaproteobacteria bacterium]|nr:YihY/virulence factor BrkB family protein [Deltaproteobacteria bacterium]